MTSMTTKILTYGTRHLVAEFNDRGRVTSIRPMAKARIAKVDEPPTDDIARLRKMAERLGIVIDGRWRLQRLQAEIEAKRK